MAKLRLKIPDYPKFQTDGWKVLMIDNGFFLYGEWEQAFTENGMEVFSFPIRYKDNIVPNYYRRLTDAVSSFRPDFIFNINFIGFDQEGHLAAMFAAINIPVIYWLIDHPFHFLPGYTLCLNARNRLLVIDSSWTTLIQEEFNLSSAHLPLAVTDYYSFLEFKEEPQYDISFLGVTGIDEISDFSCFKPNLPDEIADDFLEDFGVILAKHPERDFAELLSEMAERKKLSISFNSDLERRGYRLSATAMADFLYRKKHLNFLISKDIQIVGDERWNQFLMDCKPVQPWPDLATKYNLYHNSAINIHLSSFFLPASFNRKFLEIPLCGGFVMTDYRECYQEFYKQDVYKYFDTVSGLGKSVDYYLSHPKQRQKQLEHAKNYILTHHLYKNRIAELKNYLLAEFGE